VVIYFVKQGDTLWEIAKKFGSTVADIVRVNKIEDENKIFPGQQLFIPKYVYTKQEQTA
jgi:LysM repeat protein